MLERKLSSDNTTRSQEVVENLTNSLRKRTSREFSTDPQFVAKQEKNLEEGKDALETKGFTDDRNQIHELVRKASQNAINSAFDISDTTVHSKKQSADVVVLQDSAYGSVVHSTDQICEIQLVKSNNTENVRELIRQLDQQGQSVSSIFDSMDKQLDPHLREVLKQKTLEDFAHSHPDHKLSILYEEVGKAIEECGLFKFDITDKKESKEIWGQRYREMIKKEIKVYNLYIDIKKQIKELANSVQSYEKAVSNTSQSTSLNYQISYNNLFRKVRRTCYSAVEKIQNIYLDIFYNNAVRQCDKVQKEYFEKSTTTLNVKSKYFKAWKKELEEPLKTMSNVIEDMQEGIEILDMHARERLTNMEKQLRNYRDLDDKLSDNSIEVGKLYNDIKNNCLDLEEKWENIINIYNDEKKASNEEFKILKNMADKSTKEYRNIFYKILNDFEKYSKEYPSMKNPILDSDLRYFKATLMDHIKFSDPTHPILDQYHQALKQDHLSLMAQLEELERLYQKRALTSGFTTSYYDKLKEFLKAYQEYGSQYGIENNPLASSQFKRGEESLGSYIEQMETWSSNLQRDTRDPSKWDQLDINGKYYAIRHYGDITQKIALESIFEKIMVNKAPREYWIKVQRCQNSLQNTFEQMNNYYNALCENYSSDKETPYKKDDNENKGLMHTIFADESNDDKSKTVLTVFHDKNSKFTKEVKMYCKDLNKLSDEFKEFRNAIKSNAKLFKSATRFYGLVPYSKINNQLKKVEANLAQTQQNITNCIKAIEGCQNLSDNSFSNRIDRIERDWSKIYKEHNELFGNKENNKIFKSFNTLAFHILLTEVQDIAPETEDGLNFGNVFR